LLQIASVAGVLFEISRATRRKHLYAAEVLPSDYRLYGSRRAGSTVEGVVFVDKGVRNSCSWNLPRKWCGIGIFSGNLGGFCTDVPQNRSMIAAAMQIRPKPYNRVTRRRCDNQR